MAESSRAVGAMGSTLPPIPGSRTDLLGRGKTQHLTLKFRMQALP
jgi:hypothetical protein